MMELFISAFVASLGFIAAWFLLPFIMGAIIGAIMVVYAFVSSFFSKGE